MDSCRDGASKGGVGQGQVVVTGSLSLMCIPLSCGNALPLNIFVIYLSVQYTNLQHDGELHAEESIFGVGEGGERE